jgi:hypothetical protein
VTFYKVSNGGAFINGLKWTVRVVPQISPYMLPSARFAINLINYPVIHGYWRGGMGWCGLDWSGSG